MKLSILDIAKGIQWSDDKDFYLVQKSDSYELIVDYLNSGSIENLKNDLDCLNKFRVIRQYTDKQKIEDFIINKIDGFNYRENGYSARIVGAHDKTASVQYNIKNDTISIIHPNIPTLPKFDIDLDILINLVSQMIEILTMKDFLKFRKD